MNVKQLFDLTGRVAIITGGASGLGLQMAEALSEMGANVVLCARKIERCEQAAKQLAAKGVKTLALACDVRNPASIQEAVDRSVADFGQIDILINNAAAPCWVPTHMSEIVIERNKEGFLKRIPLGWFGSDY